MHFFLHIFLLPLQGFGKTDFLWELAGAVVARLLLPATPLLRGVLTAPTPHLSTALSHILLAASLAGCHLAALSLVWLAGSPAGVREWESQTCQTSDAPHLLWWPDHPASYVTSCGWTL